jgi:hypothetical protein
MSQRLETEASARRWRLLSACGAVAMSRMFFRHGVVATGADRAPVPRLQGEVGPKLPSPLDAMRNSSIESSIMACHRVDAPL